MSINQPTFLENEAPSTEQNDAIQKDFLDISDKIKNNPDTINKLKDHTLKNVDTYLTTNKDQAQQMLLDISDTMHKNPNLQRKDANSLRELQKLCIAKTTWEEVWTYQLHKDVLNATFDLAKLTTYGSLFQTWNTNNWFANITETYTQGANPKFDQLFTTGEFKNVYFSPAQLQKELYKKNTERRNTLVTNMKAFTLENITKFMSEVKITTIEDITGNSQEITKAIKATFPTIADPYREFNDILTKDPSIMIEWKAKMPEAKKTEMEASNNQTPVAPAVVESSEDVKPSFTKDSILTKYLETNDNKKDSIYAFNNENEKSTFEDIVTILTSKLTEDASNTKNNELIALLKDGKFKDFQAKVYGNSTTSKYKSKWNDGKLGDETLGMVKTYLWLADNETPAVKQTPVAATNDEAKTPAKWKTEDNKTAAKAEDTKEKAPTLEESIGVAKTHLDYIDGSMIKTWKESDLDNSRLWILKMKDWAEKTKYLALADNNISKLNNYKKFKDDFSKRYNNPKLYWSVDNYVKRFDNDVFSDTKLLDRLLIYEKAITLMSMIKLPKIFWGEFKLNKKNLVTFINNADKDTFDKENDVFHEENNKSFMISSDMKYVKFADDVKSFEVDWTGLNKDLKFVNVETFFKRLDDPKLYVDLLREKATLDTKWDYIVSNTALKNNISKQTNKQYAGNRPSKTSIPQ